MTARWTLVAVLLVASPAAAALESVCRPWPGEPEPVPTVASGDPALKRWSELRVAELVARAQLAEAGDPVESYRLWRRVLCFDPTNKLAWRGLDRTRVVRVYRPQVKWGPEGAAAATADPWSHLATTVSVARPAPPAPVRPAAPPPPPKRVATSKPPRQDAARQEAARQEAARQDAARQQRERARREVLGRAKSSLEQGEESLKGARFEEALGRADTARSALEGSTGKDVGALRVRVEVLAATAQVALGDDAAARESLARALAADPSLQLDPMKTSPKVMRALDAARAGSGT